PVTPPVVADIPKPSPPVMPAQNPEEAEAGDEEPYYRVQPGSPRPEAATRTLANPSAESRFRAVRRDVEDEIDRLSESLNREERRYLRKAWEEWEEFREAEVRFIIHHAWGGAADSERVWLLREQMTYDRLEALRELFPRTVVEAPSSGPEPEAAPEPEPVAKQEPAASASGARVHTVKSGESLWSIAEQYYGDGMKFDRIREANQGRFRHEKKLYVGLELIVP
ncbi:MAG: LysM peptidoglycan-binding domain-containing protein, partial [Verrucomicrobiota bacterium]